MAKQTPTVDLSNGWSTDGPSNIDRTTPGAPEAQGGAPPAAAPAADDAPRRKAAAKRGSKPASRVTPVKSTPSTDEVDLGAFRRRRRPESAQLNHRVAPELKDALDRTARALGVPSVELLEALLAELDPDSPEGVSAARNMVRAHLLAGLGGMGR